MDIKYLTPEKYGFYGAYYECPVESDSAFVFMLGPTVDNPLVKMGVKWLHSLGCNVLTLSPEPDKKGFYEIPVEIFPNAANYLYSQGNIRMGIAGGSATAMMALVGASYCSDFTLTIAMTPCDFIMEGYLRDGLDGTSERPADKSFFTCGGKELLYLPYAYRHPDYWYKVMEESKKSGNAVASRNMFNLSEKLHPIDDNAFIKVERICGTLILAGAEDDCLWNTCRYIRRMKKRIERYNSDCDLKVYTYEHGTHFMFPESMLKKSLGILSGIPSLCFHYGRTHIKACKESRMDFDRKITAEILSWKER